MTRIPFTKMHGCGNDYISVNTMQYDIPDPVAAAIKWSDRHKGIGSDGLVLIGKSSVPEADFSMRIFNADGSEAMMCGNASRCIGKYLYEKTHPWPEWPRTLKTTSSHEEGCTRRWNINTLEFLGENGKLTGVKVQEIDWKPNPEGGRPIMVEKGKPEIIKAELVLLAMGFLKPEHPEYPKNVFVCGDSANGASLVVRAMASGKQIAQKVATFLGK